MDLIQKLLFFNPSTIHTFNMIHLFKTKTGKLFKNKKNEF